MRTKIISCLLVILLVVSIHVTKAQTTGKVYRIGIVMLGFFTSGQKEILGQGLRDL